MLPVVATLVADAAPLVAAPLARISEVPELASMALLSVVFAGVSVIVRRTGPRAAGRRQPTDSQGR